MLNKDSISNDQLPPLPLWLDLLIGQDWTPENSLAVDCWLNYVSLEFEGVA